VRNPEYSADLRLISEELGLSFSVNPELTCATEIARNLRVPSAIKTDTFARGHVELLKLQLPEDSPLAGKALMELPKLVKARVLICAVERGEDEIHIPSGAFKLQAGDRISLVAPMQEARSFFRQTGMVSDPIHQVMLVGGGRISYYLAKQLLDAGMRVKIIERDYARCEELSTQLPEATILHGDGTNESFLLEAGIEHADAFASMTGIDEENVLMSMYVRKTFPKIKVITKLDRHSFRSIVDGMDLGSVYNPRTSTANQICRFVRTMQNSVGSSVETLYKLCDGKAEALEFIVRPDFPMLTIPLKEMKLKPNILLVGILRGRKAIIPSGDDMILPGDRVVVLTTGHQLHDLADIGA
jgi:trk system potassium uptake protein TrkA